jgi:predicted GIY-YIG superfamily endonuclease
VPFVYILRCGDGSLYTGIAKDPERRLAEHRAGSASRYTRSHLPVELIWMLEVDSWNAALAEECRIKELTRREKEELLRRDLRSDSQCRPERLPPA